MSARRAGQANCTMASLLAGKFYTETVGKVFRLYTSSADARTRIQSYFTFLAVILKTVLNKENLEKITFYR